MLLSDVIEEILERVGNGIGRSMSMRSLVRKVDMKHKEILRLRGNNNDDVATLDILSGVAEYPLPCSPGNITSVYLFDERLYLRDRNNYTMGNYYYLLDKTIGIFLYGGMPNEDKPQALKIFHRHVPETFTESALDAEPDIEEPYRMLLVHSVLLDIAEPDQASRSAAAYREMLNDFIQATRDPEPTTISEVFFL